MQYAITVFLKREKKMVSAKELSTWYKIQGTIYLFRVFINLHKGIELVLSDLDII